MDRRTAWTGNALAAAVAAWVAAAGCAGAPAARAPAERPSDEEGTRRRIEAVLSQRDWMESAEAGPRPRPLTLQVNDILALADSSLAAVLLERAAIETERQPGRRLSVLNLARLLAGTDRTLKSELRGPCVRECRGVVFWDELEIPNEYLDPYLTLPTPGVLPEPPLWQSVGRFRAEPFVPRGRELLEGILADSGPELLYLQRSRLAGAGYEIGLLALRDEGLRGALLAAARSEPKGGIPRVVIAVAVATAGIRETEPLLRRWAEEARESDDLTDGDMLSLGQAFEVIQRDAERVGKEVR